MAERWLGNRVIAETGAGGASLREYIWLGDQAMAVVANADTASPAVYWVTNDHLGRAVQMTDVNRTVVWRAKYRAFGDLSAVTGAASLDARFPGQWFQLEAGLSYNWHRHYDASLGRYTQPDPLGWKAGPSLYGYLGQNPQAGSDPEGLIESIDLIKPFIPFYTWFLPPPPSPPGPNSCPLPPRDDCIAECSPLLERPQRPGSDKNQFDFYKCLNACRNRKSQ